MGTVISILQMKKIKKKTDKSIINLRSHSLKGKSENQSRIF